MFDRNKIVAFAKWQYPQSLTEEQREAKKEISDGNPFGDDAPEGYNVKLSDDFFEKIQQKHRKWVDDDKDYGKHKGDDSKTWIWPFFVEAG